MNPSTLFDLQEFLESEVKDAAPGTFYRSFVPLSEGLGIQSPKSQSQKEAPTKPTTDIKADFFDSADVQPRREESSLSRQARNSPSFPDFEEPTYMKEAGATRNQPFGSAQKATSGIPVTEILQSMHAKSPRNSDGLANVINPPFEAPTGVESILAGNALSEVPADTQTLLSSQIEKTPPPLPHPTFFTRLLAGFIDELFIVTLLAISLVITSCILNGSLQISTSALLRDFLNPTFYRFALLEFAAIWLAYFTICIGIFDSTFGMWVWGIRVSFGKKTDSNYTMRKLMRIVWSFVFFAPVAPVVLLLFRQRNRNSLDLLTGTHLFLVS